MELVLTAAREGRLLGFLRGELALSSTLVKRLKQQRAIFVDGEAAHTDRPVARGAEIRVVVEEEPPSYPAEERALDVLWEDEAILAVDKPAGMWVHPTPSRQTGTLANWAAFHLRGAQCGVHVVTRLDRDTFGVVLFAKNAHIHALLSRALQEGRIEKRYLASVCGIPAPPDGFVDMPIARRPGGSLLREVNADGQRALTGYRVISDGDGLSLLELRPETGRTHQLRVHCQALGCPILGDRAYGTAASLARSEALGIKTQQLCAKALTFPHPLSGKRMTISARQNPIFPKLTVETRGN